MTLQGVLPAEVLHRRASLSLEEGAEARRRAEARLTYLIVLCYNLSNKQESTCQHCSNCIVALEIGWRVTL